MRKDKLTNYHLYFYEVIFATLLIFTHAYLGVSNYYLDSLGRATVLFFFIVSSYFYNKTLHKSDYNYLSDSGLRSLRLIIISIGVFLIYNSIFIPINISILGRPSNISEFFNKYLAKTSFIWFMVALAFCYLIYPFIHKIRYIHDSKYLLIIFPLIILISVYIFRIFAGKYDLGFFSNNYITRNFLFTGLPCFLLGTYIYDKFDHFKIINKSLFITLFLSLFLSSILEAYLHKVIGTSENEFYLSSVALSLLVVLYTLQRPYFNIGYRLSILLGLKASTIIYLFHRLFLLIQYTYINVSYRNYIIIPVTFISVLGLSIIYNLVDRKIIHRHSL